MEQAKTIAAGILPFFDGGKLILLGLEKRKDGESYWMEFGGKQEKGETLAEAACREASEETGEVLKVDLSQALSVEEKNSHVDYYNPKSGVFYRMYPITFEHLIDPDLFREQSKGKDHVEKVDWRYFKTEDVLHHKDGVLPGTEYKLYSTTITRLEIFKKKM